MAGSLRASVQGIEIVDRARKKKGWTTKYASAWWQDALTSEATLKRFWRKLPIERESFINICKAVGVNNWKEIADCSAVQQPEALEMPSADWGEAPDVSAFYGRTEEQDTLKQWIVAKGCRLVVLWGMGGIGKTALAVKLANEIQGEFEYLIWRSLRYAPPVQEILADSIRFLSQQHPSNPCLAKESKGETLPDSVDALLSELMTYLHKHRCLLVLDDFETVLKSGVLAGHYCEGYEGYGELIGRVGQERHQSCLLLTSREKPNKIAFLEEETLCVRSLKLKGLDKENAQNIFRAKGFSGAENHWGEIIELYKGNPLALKLVCTTIQDVFNGKVSDFLEEGTAVFGDIFGLLDQQFNRLSDLEKQIMYSLAINREWVSLTQLREKLVPPASKRELLEALDSLQRRCLIDKATPTLIEKSTETAQLPFTLQPVIMTYVIKYAAR